MKHIMEDGMELMAAYDDLKAFFEEHRIVGRVIADIRPDCFDYMIHNLCDFTIEEVKEWSIESGITTDGYVVLLFEDGDTLAVHFCGDGPILLGFNAIKQEQLPQYDGTIYKLSTVFKHCIGRKIRQICFEKSEYKMEFDHACGIDMSMDDDGIKDISFILDDDTVLTAKGTLDFFDLEHTAGNGEDLKVPFTELLKELSEETLHEIFDDEQA